MPDRWYRWCKNSPRDKIWWKDILDDEGTWIFSFDKKKEYYFFGDVPYALTPEQMALFEKENPNWRHNCIGR